MSRHLHIVCLDAPSPPDYGGAIDMYYKIKALAEEGMHIILHYYHYRDRRGHAGLEPYCTEVHPYRRKKFCWNIFTQPYITASRVNHSLIKRLNADAHPIFIEGLHGAALIPHVDHPQRVLLRMHNEESSYYQKLAETESSLLKQYYLRRESRLLQKFQQQMNKDVKLLPLAKTDLHVFNTEYHFRNLHFIPAFTAWDTVTTGAGKGHYCLYHGNLQVSENEAAALWLMEHVFNDLSTQLIIAGNESSDRLVRMGRNYPHIKVISNPSIEEIDQLVNEAHIHVLPSMNRTGVKLKLLHTLFKGRFVVTNSDGVDGSGLETCVAYAATAAEYKKTVTALMTQTFGSAEIEKRKTALQLYDNRVNARKIIELL